MSNHWNSREEYFNRAPRRSVFGWGVSAIVIVAGLTVVGGTVSLVINLASQPARVVQKTFDADNMIANYEWFRQQYADVQAMSVKLANAETALSSFETSAGPRTDWKLSDRQQWDQLNRIVLGLRNQRATMVAEYNGRASQTNRAIFINPPVVGGPVLPERLD